MDRELLEDLQDFWMDYEPDEKKRKLQKEYLKKELEELVSTKGWQRYKAFLKHLADKKASKLLQPVTSIEEILYTEREKGRVWGLVTHMDLPENMISSIAEDTNDGTL